MRTTRNFVAASACVLLAGCSGEQLPPTGTPPVVTAPRLDVAPATQAGKWTDSLSWPIVAAHMTVLPDGRVLSWTANDLDHSFNTPNVYLWNPAAPTAFSQVPNAFTDVFCSAHSFLPDGTLLVAGGHVENDHGSKDANIFNYQSSTWGRLLQMRAGRWYPTTAAMGTGDIVVAAGSDEHAAANPFPEVWDGAKFRLLSGAPLAMPYYPWLHSGPDGRIFNSGPDQRTRYLNPSGDGEWTDYGQTAGGVYRDYGTGVAYEPGKVLIIGGGDPPVNTAEVVDLNTGAAWKPTGSMQYARRQFNALVVADGKVLVIGGTNAPGFNTESGSILAPEIWDPATGLWTTLASMKVPRTYHSTAVLLPDARVLSAGGGRCGTSCVDHRDATIYSPPYLFNADGTTAVRPTITSAPSPINRGQAFTIATPDAASISRATLVRMPSTTHGFSMNQAFTNLTVSQTAGGVSVTVLTNANLLPAGHYMLFILNGNGVPSVAKIVQLMGTTTPATPPAAPAAPTTLTASAVSSSSQVNLQWADNSTSESSFRIERCQGAGCTGFVEIAFVAANTVSYGNTGLTAGTTYSYRVRAMNAAGPSGYSNTSTATLSAPPVSTPAITLTAKRSKANRGQRVDLKWSGATTGMVDVYRNGALLVTTANNTGTKSGSYTDNIDGGSRATYTYKVCEAGRTNVCSGNATVTF